MAMSRATARRPATYEDLLQVPDHLVAEIIDGDLHTSPRPNGSHTLAASVLGDELLSPFQRGRGGPGGWWILDEPELHLGPDVLVPDLAGWRRERLPSVAGVTFFTVAPDWLCEIVSPSTERLDRGRKLAIYPREGVRNVWLVNPVARTLEVMRLEGGRWVLLGVHLDDEMVRAEPFEAIAVDLLALWGETREG
jgi:Uma2 family endonuclease